MRPLPKDPCQSNHKYNGSLQDSEAPGAPAHTLSQPCLGHWVITEISCGNQSVLQSRVLPQGVKYCSVPKVTQKGNRKRSQKGQVAGSKDSDCLFILFFPLPDSMPCFSPFILRLGPPPRHMMLGAGVLQFWGALAESDPNFLVTASLASNSRHSPSSGPCSGAPEETSHPDTVDQGPRLEEGVKLG